MLTDEQIVTRTAARYNRHLNDISKPKCCNDGDITFIQSHGLIKPTNDIILLPAGYKVILFGEFNKCIKSLTDHEEGLKELYLDGNTLFDNGDTNIFKLSDEGVNWLRNVNSDLGMGDPMIDYLMPRLFIGGSIDIAGNPIQIKIPEMELHFMGDKCEKWPYKDNKYIDDYNCYIDCVYPGNYDMKYETRCEKYYNKSVLLSQLLGLRDEFLQPTRPDHPARREGTYIIFACMNVIITNTSEIFGDYDMTKEQQRWAYMNQARLTAERPPAGSTRSRTSQILDWGKKFEGGKKKKTRKQKKKKTRKQKKKKTRKQKNNRRVKTKNVNKKLRKKV